MTQRKGTRKTNKQTNKQKKNKAEIKELIVTAM